MQTADFTIAEFLDWAKTKPAGEEYDFFEADVCAVAQFGKATGRDHLVGLGGISEDGGISRELEDAVLGTHRDGARRWTYGALADRLEALLLAEPLSDTWTTPDAYLTDIEDVARERVMS